MTASLRAGEYQSLLRHMEWADALVWTAVLGLREAQQDARLLERLHHLHVVQWVYLQVWRGEPMRVPELGTFSDLTALAAWARPYYPKLREFVQHVTDDALSARLEFPWASEVVKRLGSAGPATLGESVLQVVLHSTYHRGQVATRIRELGGEPPLTDFIAWAWKERPDPAWRPASDEGHPMNCFVHDRVPAVGFCAVCQKAVCRDCVGVETPRLVCRACLDARAVIGFEYRSQAGVSRPEVRALVVSGRRYG